jgi:CubicO group peptidase (beta-lactamase class C family)
MLFTKLSCLLVPAVALVSFAQAPSPTNPAIQQLQNWLAAFDGADWQAYLAFVQKNFVTEPERMLRSPAFRNMTKGFDVEKIEAETPVQVSAVIEERATHQMARIVVEVEAAEPHRILQLHMQPILPAHLAEKELSIRTGEFVQQMVSEDKFSGVVLIAKDGEPIFRHAYGFADRERRILNTVDTRFGTASMGKMFTAVATLQLVEAGKLKLDQPIGNYLTDYPNKDLASKVTIHQLLTHTGGTGDIFGPELEKHRLEVRTNQDYIHLFGSRPLAFDPGSRWEYSNYGFVILGAIIERVSGENYYDYLRRRIFDPAGMTSVRFPSEGEPEPGRSVEYTKQGGTIWRRATSHPSSGPIRGMAAGGASTTIDDLLRFANALRDHKLLDAHYTELLTTGQVPTPSGGHYALGFQDGIWNGLRCFGHDGAAPGVSGDLRICPQGDDVVAVLANVDPPIAQLVSSFVVNRLPEPGAPSGK